jgi:hypothetical protein
MMSRSSPSGPAFRTRRPSARLAAAVWPVAALLCFSFDASQARGGPIREYDLKAAFLFNFTQFVEWPPEAFPDASAPFVIGVLGHDPFGRSLDEIVAHESVRNRRIVARRYRNVQEISTCHVLYIGASETSNLSRILAQVDGRHILTVGEADLFTTYNGIIQFLVVENRLRLRINVEAARTAKLSISSQLLRQAEIVGGK